jgi:hypothetical protein
MEEDGEEKSPSKKKKKIQKKGMYKHLVSGVTLSLPVRV